VLPPPLLLPLLLLVRGAHATIATRTSRSPASCSSHHCHCAAAAAPAAAALVAKKAGASSGSQRGWMAVTSRAYCLAVGRQAAGRHIRRERDIGTGRGTATRTGHQRTCT
jgi:hypothetical protein